MKHLLLIFATLLLGTLSIQAQYTTPGNGSNYTFADLVTLSSGAVTEMEDDGYTIHQAITIAATDTLSVTENLYIGIDSAVTIDFIESVFYCNPPNEAIFTGAEPTERYGAIHLNNAHGSYITNSVFAYGGGIKISNSENVVITHCELSENQANGSSGVISIFQSSPTISHCYFEYNPSAAITSALNAMSSPEISYCDFYYNNANNTNVPQINLGQSAEAPIIIRGNIIEGDEELDMVGGISIFHIYDSEVHAIIDSNMISNNRYGINVQGNQITYEIKDNTLVDNNTETNPNNGGSGITFYGSENTGTVTNNVISGNLWGITILGEATPNLGNMSDGESAGGGNQIYNNGNNGQPYNLYNNSANNIMAQGNYWGTMNEDSVEMGIFHQPDLESLGLVNYLPLYDPNAGSGIDEKMVDFSVFPNPANNFIQINSKTQISSAQIYSIDGKLISQHQLYGMSEQINTSSLGSGIYILQVIDSNGNVGRIKLIIE